MSSPLTPSFAGLTQRMTSRFSSSLRTLRDAVVPVIVIGRDHADQERGIVLAGGASNAAAGEVSTHALHALRPLELVAAWCSRAGGPNQAVIWSAGSSFLPLAIQTYPTTVGAVDFYELLPAAEAFSGSRALIAGVPLETPTDTAAFFPIAGCVMPAGAWLIVQCSNLGGTGRGGFAFRPLA